MFWKTFFIQFVLYLNKNKYHHILFSKRISFESETIGRHQKQNQSTNHFNTNIPKSGFDNRPPQHMYENDYTTDIYISNVFEKMKKYKLLEKLQRSNISIHTKLQYLDNKPNPKPFNVYEGGLFHDWNSI